MPLTYKQITKIVEDYNFKITRIKGSHFRYELNNKGVIIAFHKEYPPKTAKSMLNTISEIINIPYKDLVKKYNIKL